MKSMNVAQQLRKMAQMNPGKKAVIFPEGEDLLGRMKYTHLTFQDLDGSSDHLANELGNLGVKRGDKVLLFLKPSLEFSVVTFALFKLGAVPVFMDPGMGPKNLLNSIRHIRPEALIAVPLVIGFVPFFRRSFTSVRTFISSRPVSWMGKFLSWLGGGGKDSRQGRLFSLPQLLQGFWSEENHRLATHSQETRRPMAELGADETCAILYTSGGTGIPKGVIYTHRIFEEQIRILKETFQLDERDVDMPGFPLFSLFTMCMGMTSALPDMNPSKPAQCSPVKLVKTLIDQGVTFAAGSPAIWERVADYCLQRRIQLPQLRRLVMFGAPVQVSLLEKWEKLLPHGDTYTPYGATECLPITHIAGKEIILQHKELFLRGQGTCVGKPIGGIKIRIMDLETPIPPEGKDWDISAVRFLGPEQRGEIVVSGSVTTAAYAQMEKETRLSKIWDGERLWHRMGDVGYLDQEGRLWFCGRRAHLVHAKEKLYYSIPCETIFNQHPEVARSALIGLGPVGRQGPAIVIEDPARRWSGPGKDGYKEKLKRDLKEMAQKHDHTREIDRFFFVKNFPVDIRHNIKIDRQLLKEWAEQGKGTWT